MSNEQVEQPTEDGELHEEVVSQDVEEKPRRNWLGKVTDKAAAKAEEAPAPKPAPKRGRLEQAEHLLKQCAEEFDALGRGKTLRKRIADFLRG